MIEIDIAVVPVAGLGTRLLPATKSQPKEMLPVGRKPIVQYVVEELTRVGIKRILFITGTGKTSIENHFDINVELIAQRDQVPGPHVWEPVESGDGERSALGDHRQGRLGCLRRRGEPGRRDERRVVGARHAPDPHAVASHDQRTGPGDALHPARQRLAPGTLPHASRDEDHRAGRPAHGDLFDEPGGCFGSHRDDEQVDRFRKLRDGRDAPGCTIELDAL